MVLVILYLVELFREKIDNTSCRKNTQKAPQFSKREKILKDLQVVEVMPIVTKLIDKINTGPITEQNRRNFVTDLTFVKDQLTLRGKLRKQSSIIKKTQRILVRIRSLTFVELLAELNDQISSNEKVTIENLIHKLEDAIKQKNYAVMEKLNEEVKRIFPAFCDLD